MAADDLYFDGQLVNDGMSLPVMVRYASRYSLWLRFAGRGPDNPTTTFEKFTLQADGKTVEMGPCDLTEEPGGPGGEFRLVPLRSIHDFEQLLFRSRVAILESSAVNLSLILSYKRSIEPEFSQYVSDLTYDLSAYRTMFDEIDASISDEPELIRAALQRGIIDNLGTAFLDYLERQHTTLKAITSGLTDQQHEHHGFFFRKQLWTMILTTPIMTRTNLKPRGYVGDSQMMNMIYHNEYLGDSTFGRIMHKYAVDQVAAVAVRNRRGTLAEALRTFAQNRLADDVLDGTRLKVLSVACGPAMELNDILQTVEDCRRLHFTLLDQDRYALLEAASVIEDLEKNLGTSVSTNFIRESVRTLLVTRELQDRWGLFDYIYSMGLFDYLTRPVATRVLEKLYNLLLPGGELNVGNFSVNNPTMVYMAYWMDWTIIYRTEAEMISLAAGLDGADVSVDVDDTGVQLFLRIRKPVE